MLFNGYLDAFVVNFEKVWCVFLVFILLILNAKLLDKRKHTLKKYCFVSSYVWRIYKRVYKFNWRKLFVETTSPSISGILWKTRGVRFFFITVHDAYIFTKTRLTVDRSCIWNFLKLWLQKVGWLPLCIILWKCPLPNHLNITHLLVNWKLQQLVAFRLSILSCLTIFVNS